MTNNSKREKQEKDEEKDHPEGEKSFDDKQVALLSGGFKKQAHFKKIVFSEYMRSEQPPVSCADKKLERQITSVSAYMQACKIPKENCAIMVLTAADVKFFCDTACMVSTLSSLLTLLSGTQNLVLPAMADEKIRKGI